MLLVRYPHADPRIGMAPGSRADFQPFAGWPDHGLARATSWIDGKDRLIAAYRVPHYPRRVVASDTIPEILASRSHESRAFIGAAGLFELLLCSRNASIWR